VGLNGVLNALIDVNQEPTRPGIRYRPVEPAIPA
jgi:hypothetical protein